MPLYFLYYLSFYTIHFTYVYIIIWIPGLLSNLVYTLIWTYYTKCDVLFWMLCFGFHLFIKSMIPFFNHMVQLGEIICRNLIFMDWQNSEDSLVASSVIIFFKIHLITLNIHFFYIFIFFWFFIVTIRFLEIPSVTFTITTSGVRLIGKLV